MRAKESSRYRLALPAERISGIMERARRRSVVMVLTIRGEDSEEDSLVVKDRSPAKGILKQALAQKRVEVDDDESASDDF